MTKRRPDDADCFVADLRPPRKLCRFDKWPPWTLANNFDLTLDERTALASDKMLISVFNDWDVSFNPQLTENEIGGLIGMRTGVPAPHLNSFNFSYTTISDAFIFAFCRFAPELTQIRLDGCQRLSDNALRLLADGCPKLTVLSLAKCEWVTDQGVEALSRLPQLQAVDLSDCRKVTGDSLTLLVERCLLVQTLRIGGTSVDAVALSNIVSLLLLVELDVSGLPFDDHHLRALAHSQPILQRLNVSFCYDITEAAFVEFAVESNVREIKAFGLIAAKLVISKPDLRIIS